MKSRFFGGMFAGFILACLFFFGVMHAKAQPHHYGDQTYEHNMTPAARIYSAYYNDRAYYANYYHGDHAAVYYYDYEHV